MKVDHSSPKPWQCECERRFARYVDFKTHVDHECPDARRAFTEGKAEPWDGLGAVGPQARVAR